MLNRGWCGTLLCGVILVTAARGLAAQDAQTRDKELEDLKRRLEILENEKQKAPALGASIGLDPVEEKWYDRVKVGGGVRTSYKATEVPIIGGTKSKYTSDFQLESGRLYTGGKITDNLSATLNAEFTSGSASVLDAIAQFKVSDSFNIFMGRMLPATDRSNSDGPYYLSTWEFPFLSDAFNAVGKLGDRDDGITFWGDVGNFKYWAGVYEGHEQAAPPNARFNDRLLYAARVQYDFLDSEGGYYLSSTYYGEKQILAIGLVANYQGHAAGTAATPANFGNVAVDFLWESKLSWLADGVGTVEAAYYYFGRHGFGFAEGAAGPFDTGAGTGFLFSIAYLIPGKVGWGQFQPHFRYQGFNESESGGNNTTANNKAQYDLGVNYVMSGHNARISFVYSHTAVTGPKEFGQFLIGTQFQF